MNYVKFMGCFAVFICVGWSAIAQFTGWRVPLAVQVIDLISITGFMGVIIWTAATK